MATYTRTTSVDASPSGDTVKQAVLDVDTDLTGIVTAYNTHDTNTTAVHGLGAGTVCGTTNTQTLTNKTIQAPTLTGTVTSAGATFTGGTAVNLILQTPTLTGTIDASGVTFTSPTITNATINVSTISAPTITGVVTATGATVTGGTTINQTIQTPTLTGAVAASGATISNPTVTGATINASTISGPILTGTVTASGATVVSPTVTNATINASTISGPILTGTVTASGATVVSPTVTNATIQSSTVNGLTHTAATTGFTISGGTASKTLTVGDTAILPAMVDRGDPAAYDKQVGDFTTDEVWRDLDLSAIVPAGARFISLTVIIQDDAVNSVLQFRKNGNSNAYNVYPVCTQVVNQRVFAVVVVPCDTNRVIEYYATNTTWTTINVAVTGWIF